MSIGTSSGDRERFTYEEFDELASRNQVFASLFASESSPGRLNLSIGGGRPEQAIGALVSETYFPVLGVNPILGRTFTPEEAKGPGSDPLAVINYTYWKQRFGLDPSVLGKTILINKTYFTIIGVMPPPFLWRNSRPYARFVAAPADGAPGQAGPGLAARRPEQG